MHPSASRPKVSLNKIKYGKNEGENPQAQYEPQKMEEPQTSMKSVDLYGLHLKPAVRHIIEWNQKLTQKQGEKLILNLFNQILRIY